MLAHSCVKANTVHAHTEVQSLYTYTHSTCPHICEHVCLYAHRNIAHVYIHTGAFHTHTHRHNVCAHDYIQYIYMYS